MTNDELTLSTSFLAGARKKVALRHDAGVADKDSDFMAFVVIESDTDALPIGTASDRWNKHALARLEPEIQSAETWARDQGAADWAEFSGFLHAPPVPLFSRHTAWPSAATRTACMG